METTEAFSRVKIDAQLGDVGWKLTDNVSVRYEYSLPDGTKADYVFRNRHGHSLAVVEARRASINPVEAEDQGKAYAEQAQNRLWGDILSAYLYKDQRGKTAVQRIEAFGHVRVTTPQDVVVGDQGLYDVETRTAILCGAVKINRGGDLVTGKVAEVNLTTGRARIRPGRCTFTVK